MSGFGIYETLRIFAPGALAVAIANLVARFSFGDSAFTADGPATGFADFVGNVGVATTLALLIGLLLYALDFPTRFTLYGGADPQHNVKLPTQVLREQLAGSDLAPKSFGLYFILSDAFMPEEMHKRVYLFGSLFRVFADLRALLAAAMVAGAAVALVDAAGGEEFELTQGGLGDGLLATAAIIGAIAGVGVLGGVRAHATRFRSKRAREGSGGTFRARLRRDLRAIAWAWVIVFVSGTVAVGLMAAATTAAQAVGVLLAIAGYVLWASIEIGPPKVGDQFGWRSRLLRRLRADCTDAQYSVFQRLLADIALFGPWLVGAALAGANQGRAATHMFAWALLVVPATAIMSIRKHEIRLLNVFQDQCLWLELNTDRLARLRTSGRLSDWEAAQGE